jgi:hypothetical protein
VPRHVLGGPGKVAPNAKTTLACIGVGGQGTINLMNFLDFNEVQVVAVCDVDRESTGFLSWNWGQGKEGKIFGHRIYPESKQKAYGKPPKTLPRSPGHYKEFVDACRGGPVPGFNFVDHAGVLSETPLLANVALRAGKKLLWDGPALKITNDKDANKLLHRQYRQGWSL